MPLASIKHVLILQQHHGLVSLCGSFLCGPLLRGSANIIIERNESQCILHIRMSFARVLLAGNCQLWPPASSAVTIAITRDGVGIGEIASGHDSTMSEKQPGFAWYNVQQA